MRPYLYTQRFCEQVAFVSKNPVAFANYIMEHLICIAGSASAFRKEPMPISPSAFFDTDTQNPEKIDKLVEKLKHLNDAQLDSLFTILDGLISLK